MKRGVVPSTPVQRQIETLLGINRGRRRVFADQAIAQFWRRVDQSGGPDACWPWTGPPMNTGYGQVFVLGQHWNAHAFAYYVTKFGITPGHHIDHECHNQAVECEGGPACRHRLCCNPAHLVAKVPQANTDAANEARRRGKFKTECAKGHEYDEANTGWLIRKSGPRAGERQRYCLTCNRDNVARMKAKAV